MNGSQKSRKIISIRSVKNDNYNAAADRANNYIGYKIKEARNSLGLSLSDFSSLLEEYGVSVGNGAINKWELGRSSPNAYQLIAIAKCLNVDDDFSFFMSSSIRDQLNSEGRKKLISYKDDLIASGRYRPQAPVFEIKYIEMPISNLRVSAGSGAFLDEGSFENISFPESSVPQGADFGVRVSGDSMEPVYHDGQIVWIQKSRTVNIGEVGIFIYNGEGYIKAYDEQEPTSEDIEAFTDSTGVLHKQPVMISYNKKYSPKVVTANTDFQIIGRVL